MKQKQTKNKETDEVFKQKPDVEEKIKKLTKKALPKDLNFVSTQSMDDVLSHTWDKQGNYVGKLGKKADLK